MMGWGCEPLLFSAIERGDIAAVCCLLAHGAIQSVDELAEAMSALCDYSNQFPSIQEHGALLNEMLHSPLGTELKQRSVGRLMGSLNLAMQNA